VKVGEWQQVVMELPQGSSHGPIRVDPADCPCVIEFSGVVLKRAINGQVLRSWSDTAEMLAMKPTNNLVRLPDSMRTRFLSTGTDPQLSLPDIESALADQPLVLEARVRIDDDLSSVVPLFEAAAAGLSVGAQVDRAAVDREAAETERDAALARVQHLTAEIRNLQAERVAVVAEYRRVHVRNESLVNEVASLKGRLASESEQFREEISALKEELNVVYGSRSWWLTAPLRWLNRAIR
jgi:hypothetical protein